MPIDYNAVISNATNAYNNTVSGYKAQLAAQQQQQQGVIAGYNDLQKGVLGGLEESSAVAGKQIADQYSQDAAKGQMMLFRQGLGNSTTRNNMLSQLGKNQAFAQTDRMAKYATMAADKRTQLGLAGLGYAGNAIDANSRFAAMGLNYAGEGAMGLGRLAEGFAGFENQRAMQEADYQNKLKMQQFYGVGGGGRGGIGGGRIDEPGGGFRGVNGPMGSPSPMYSGRPEQLFPYRENSPSSLSFGPYSGGGQVGSAAVYGGLAGAGATGDGWSYASAEGGVPGSNDGWLYEGTDY